MFKHEKKLFEPVEVEKPIHSMPRFCRSSLAAQMES